MTTRGGARERGGHFYARARYGRDDRFEGRVPWAKSDDEARERGKVIAGVAEQLCAIGRRDLVLGFADELAAAPNERRLKTVMHAVDLLLQGARVAASPDIVFEDWARRYTSGELSAEHPDHVKVKDWDDDISRLKVINKIIGRIPVTALQLEHGDLVMSKLPARAKSEASRRHYAQIMTRLMHLAVYPGKLIKASPFPSNWLPKITTRRHFSCLFPREETMLLASEKVAASFRLFCGVLDREGMRLSELLDVDWWQLNLEEGTFTATKTKTDDPRMWALRPDTADALRIWKERAGDAARPFSYVLALVGDDRRDLAKYYRASLRAAGVERKELFESTEHTGALRAHDMRATFVTVSLAEGKSDTWIRDRTAHKSTSMLDRYRRTARQFAELKLGSLPNLVDALGWGQGGAQALVDPPVGVPKTPIVAIGSLPTSRSGGTVDAADSKSVEPSREVASRPDRPGETDVSRQLETLGPHPVPTPLATNRDDGGGTERGTDHVAHVPAPDRPGPARAEPRSDVREGKRKLASVQRGAAALVAEFDLLEEQVAAFSAAGDDGDGEP